MKSRKLYVRISPWAWKAVRLVGIMSEKYTDLFQDSIDQVFLCHTTNLMISYVDTVQQIINSWLDHPFRWKTRRVSFTAATSHLSDAFACLPHACPGYPGQFHMLLLTNFTCSRNFTKYQSWESSCEVSIAWLIAIQHRIVERIDQWIYLLLYFCDPSTRDVPKGAETTADRGNIVLLNHGARIPAFPLLENLLWRCVSPTRRSSEGIAMIKQWTSLLSEECWWILGYAIWQSWWTILKSTSS